MPKNREYVEALKTTADLLQPHMARTPDDIPVQQINDKVLTHGDVRRAFRLVYGHDHYPERRG